MNEITRKNEDETLPFTMPTASEELWDLAGVSPQMRADLLRQAYEVTQASLMAMKQDRVSWKGAFTDQKSSIDYQSRLRAVREAQNLAGLDKVKEVKPTVTISIITPSWAIQGSPKQINPRSEDDKLQESKLESVPDHATPHE